MSTTPAELAAAYRLIADSRMRALPVFNANLTVEAVGFRQWEGRFAGILISPWFMNLVVLPAAPGEWDGLVVGDALALGFPAGEYSFNLCELADGSRHLSLALFSTVQDFPDQDTAREVAGNIVQELFAVPALQCSRRTLLRQAAGARESR